LSLPNTIGVIFDFDDTLGEDTTNLFMKKKLGMSGSQIRNFWSREVGILVQEGWDPPLAYIHLILERARSKRLGITNKDLRHLGKRVRLHRGVPDVFRRLQDFVRARQEFQEAHVGIEFFVISGGFEEIIRGTPIAREMKDIFGCTFDETREGLVPKSIVTFTEKTKFLYAINKGLSGRELRRNPYSVNDVIPTNRRRIPFSNMIYLGDGPTDIPCFSSVQHFGGKTIGILKYKKKSTREGDVLVDKNRAWAIAKGERTTLGPFQPDYRRASDLYVNLRMQVERIALEICDVFRRRG
jgi:hypothetical protein